MAGGLPIGLSLARATDHGSNTGSSVGTTVTASATPNTKGSYAQIVASSAIDCCWVLISLDPAATFNSAPVESGIDIAIGALGSEILVVSNLVVPGWSNTSQPATARYSFPVSIPAGTRISARSQSNIASASCRVQIILFDGAVEQMEGAVPVVDTYGFSAATSDGTTLDPGAVGNTKGAWVQLTSSTTSDLMGIFVSFDDLLQSAGAQGGNMIAFLADIGIGASGSEVVILPNIPLIKGCTSVDGQQQVYGGYIPFLPINIPSGTRIAARCQTTITTAIDRLIGVTLYGVRQ